MNSSRTRSKCASAKLLFQAQRREFFEFQDQLCIANIALLRVFNSEKCGCNHDDSWHQRMDIKRPTNNEGDWNSEKHTKTMPTNAHGKLKLRGYGRLRAGEKPKVRKLLFEI